MILDCGNADSIENLKAIAKIMNCNLLKAKDIIADSDVVLAEGRAVEIEGFIHLLLQSSLKYHIEPEWPY